VEPIEVPDDDAVPEPASQVVQHLAVGRPFLAAVCADVVVHVLLGDSPPASGGLSAAVFKLPLDSESLAGAVL
jgi:hypothetical protein